MQQHQLGASDARTRVQIQQKVKPSHREDGCGRHEKRQWRPNVCDGNEFKTDTTTLLQMLMVQLYSAVFYVCALLLAAVTSTSPHDKTGH